MSFEEIVRKIKTARVLVAGDVMLDLYVRGAVERISPEAPVPVVVETAREYSLGGAGNVARNVASLGARAALLSAVGGDPEGKILGALCRKNHLVPHFVQEEARPTSQKMRAMAGQYQLLRIDRERVGTLGRAAERDTVQRIARARACDVVIVSDYAKGFVTRGVVEALKKRFGAARLIANIKPSTNPLLYRGIQAITLNAKEGQALTGISVANDKGAARAAGVLAKRSRTAVLLTRGEYGMTVSNVQGMVRHIPAQALHIFDVTGAGDTVVAVFALLCAIGTPLFEAAEAANRAGGIVVGMHGTAALGVGDLKKILKLS